MVETTQNTLLVGKWRMNYHVATVATLTPDQAQTLLFGVQNGNASFWYEFEPRDLLVTIDYPLNPGVQIKINPGDYSHRKMSSIGKFLLCVAKAYKDIYRSPKKYGIRGHGITDLYFESVTVACHGVVDLSVGS